MTKAQQMLATAGFPDTKQGRASFHKQYPTSESFFQVYGNIHGNVLKDTGPSYSIDNITSNTTEDETMYRRGGPVMYREGGPFEEQTGEDPFVPGKSYLQGWENSPMFKSIIQNQAEAMYPSKPKSAADYYKRNTSPMYIPQGKSLMGISAKNNNPNMYARFLPKDIIGIEKGLMDKNPALGNNLYTRAAILNYNPATSMDAEIIDNTPAKRVKGEYNEYEYGDPLKASVHGLRQAGQASGIYDPFTQPFKKEYIDQYNEFYKTNPDKNPLNQLLKFYTPEQVEYFMNNISQNQTQSEDGVQMASRGGMVKYADGDTVTNPPEEDEFAASKNYFQGWYNSPMFKNILKQQAEATYPSNPKKADKYFNYYNKPMFVPTPKSIIGVTNANKADRNFEFKKDIYTKDFPNDVIAVDKDFMLKNPEMGNNLFTQHAAFHYKYPTTMDTTLIGNTPKKNEDSYYYNEPYAENEFLIGGIHGLRQAAKSSGIYDPFNERFKKEYIEKFDDFYKDFPEKNPLNELKKLYSNDQIEYLMNTISENRGQSGDNMQMARNGGTVDAYQLMGMPTPRMFGPGGPTNPNDMSLFSMTYGKPNRYFETKQEGDKYFVQQRGDFPLSNQQFKNWNSPSATFSGPNQLNEWRSIGANEYNKLNSQAVDGRIGYKTYARGGHVTNYNPSFKFGKVQSDNTTYRHGFANGGHVGMYNFGSTIEDVGKLGLNTLAAPLEQISGNNFVNFDYNNKGMADAAAVSEGVIGGATDVIGSTFGGPIYGMGKQAIGGVTQGLGNNTEYQKGANDWANKTGQITSSAGDLVAGIASGNPQQIVGGASNLLGTAGGELGSKELATIGKIGNVASQFMGMGQGMKGMNAPTQSITPFNSNFGTGMPGGNLSNFGIGFAAMGGAVNAPNMMKYDAGSNVINPNNLSPKQQFDLFLKAKPVTKYFSPAMPFHPKDGSMDPRGTVVGSIDPRTGEPIEINIEKKEARWKLPNKTDYVTTAKDTAEILNMHKNRDLVGQATKMSNIKFDKERKEAKQKEQQDSMMQQQMMMQQMMQQQMMPEDIMSARYGGMVEKYENAADVKPGEFDPSYFNKQRAITYGAPLLLGLETLLDKPFQMNPEDYQIKTEIDPYEEQYRPDYRTYNAALYAMNKVPGSGNLAGRTNLYNAAEQNYADQRYKVNQGNLARRMAAQQAKLGIEGQNLGMKFNIHQFNQQNIDALDNARREQFGKRLPEAAVNDMTQQMTAAGLSAYYKDYPFPWNKKKS